MPNLTPVNDSNSWVMQASSDAVWSRVSAMGATSTTASVTMTNSTVGQAQFPPPIIAKTVYAAPTPTVTTINATVYGQAVSVYTQSASTPIKLVSMTSYGNLIPTVNATVWNSANSAQSLFLVSNANDIVSFKVALVADSVV